MLIPRRTLITSAAFLLAVPCAPRGASAAPLAIAKVKDLSFGNFVGGKGFSGTITVDPSGGRSSSGTVRLLSGGTVSAAQYTITGNAGTRYALTIPGNIVLSSGVAQMAATLTPSIATTGALPAAGTLTFTVGATASVTPTQGSGSYSATFDVTVVRN